MNIKTERLYFSIWNDSMANLAIKLWTDPQVARFINKNGAFTESECLARLETEIHNFKTSKIQYFPIFLKEQNNFVGVCGLRPTNKANTLEFGIHLLPDFWHQGLAFEASSAILNYAFDDLKVHSLIAGHHPNNSSSKKLLVKLGFHFIKNEYYLPTGLEHPTYNLSVQQYIDK
ncbi:GNAT family N-acetyltransferase [Weissella jogaejeotgali]